MKGKYLLYGTLAAGITLFVWQTVSNVAIPWHKATVASFKDNAAAVQAIRAQAPTNGVYYAPEGIVLAQSLTPTLADKSKSMGPNMAKQIVIDLLAALFLCLVLGKAGARRTAGDVAVKLGAVGLTAGMIKEFSDWNWYGFAGSYALVNTIDLAIQFVIAGFVITWIQNRMARSDAVTPDARSHTLI
ncbi:MAG: hypothetical protein ACREMS_03180 [Gemmatimonadaceae bacterium]